MIIGRRKDLLDDNNYINRFGKITHVCPNCGTVYSSTLKLSVNCTIINCRATEDNTYKVETPAIKKICTCCNNTETVQVDNSVADIYKILVEKGYKVLDICEGHVYDTNNLNTYALPYIKVEGNIKKYIPEMYKKILSVEFDFDHTDIYTGKTYECACMEFEDVNAFNSFKCKTLNDFLDLVRALPVHKAEVIDDTDLCRTSCICNHADGISCR